MHQFDNTDSSIQQPAEPTDYSARFSPLRFLIIIIAGIFLAEVFAMVVLLYFSAWHYALQTLIDATMMVVLISPVVYYFSFRPLLLHTEKRQQAEKRLQEAYEELELRVQERTEELRIANSDLEEEINVRKRADEALIQSEQRLRRAQEIAHLGSWELDLINDELTWSDEVYRIFGLQPQEFGATYEAFLEAVHSDDRTAVNEAYSGSIREGRDTYEIEHRIVRHDSGELRVVHERCEHFRDKMGRIVRSVGMVHDITERKQAEEALQKNEAMLRAVLNQMPSGVTVRDAFSGELLLSNARSLEILGNLVHTTDQLSDYHGLHPDGSYYRSEEWPVSRSIATGVTVDGEEIELQLDDSTCKTISISSAPIQDAQGQIVSGVAVFHDITERKRAERQLQQLNRTLHAHNASSQAVLRATNETELLAEVCKIVVEVCGHAMVWIGYAEDDDEKSVRPVASAGFDEGYLETMKITWADSERGRGPTGTAIRTGKPCACRNMLTDAKFTPWRKQALQRGYASSIVLPLMADKKAFGAMTIYSRKSDAFSAEEETLLSELATDLAHGIATIRLRGAHERAEKALRAAHDELELRVQERTEELAIANRDLVNEIRERKKVEQKLRIQTAAMEAAANGMVITDPRGTIEWANPAMTQIAGYEAHELIGQGMNLFHSGKHNADFYRQLWETILAGNVWRGETTNRRKDSSLYVEEQTITPVLDRDSQISHFISIKQDVTERKLMYAQLEEANRELTAISKSERQQRKVAETLSQASIALSQTLDIQHVMETILDYIQMVLPVDAAFLVLSEGDDQYKTRCVRFVEDQSPVRNLLNRSIDLLNAPVIKPFFEQQTSTLIRDSQLIERWDPPAELAAMRSWLGIPLASSGKTIGMVVAANSQPDFFHNDQVELAEAVVSQATVALQNAWLFEQVRSGRQRLQLLSRHLVEVQENERKYIARELHDETGQALTSLKLGLRAIEQISAGEAPITQHVTGLKLLADEILESLHRLAMNLRPASLDHLGLVGALTGLVQSTGERSGIVTRFKSLGVDQRQRITEDIESSAFRIVQESLTNIVRHAKATCADVILEWQEDKITIIVEDDGIGIDLEAARASGQLGLVGMQERTEMLGGKLLIDSSPNAGTTLVVEIPYAH